MKKILREALLLLFNNQHSKNTYQKRKAATHYEIVRYY